MTNTMSRFKIVNGGTLMPPGKCAVCGSVSKACIDFGFDLDFYGVVYICIEDCFNELAQQLDYVHARHVKGIEELAEQFKKEIIELDKENGELRAALGIVDRIRSDVPDPNQLQLDFESESGETEPGTEETEPGSPEQVNESGSTDVQHDDSLEKLLKFSTEL